jgi:hypothetical protein
VLAIEAVPATGGMQPTAVTHAVAVTSATSNSKDDFKYTKIKNNV